jgi:mono/diheme cytochrome c family protein
LHQQGGVPLRWQMSLPPGDSAAGRQAFIDFGCHGCHRVAGESFSADASNRPGPDLSGMGSHHPAAYFAEAILNPDAVLIDAPGYIGEDGHSIMPTYPEMTTGQLSDLVAYLASLKDGGDQSCHGGGSSAPSTAVIMSPVDLQNRPAPPASEAHAFFAQTYDVLPGQQAAFEAWFATRGRQQFLAADGLVSIETFVDASRPGAAVTSLFGFRDEAALRNFMGDPATADVWKQFDAFLGPHGHHASDRPLVYRAPSLSTK